MQENCSPATAPSPRDWRRKPAFQYFHSSDLGTLSPHALQKWSKSIDSASTFPCTAICQPKADSLTLMSVRSWQPLLADFGSPTPIQAPKSSSAVPLPSSRQQKKPRLCLPDPVRHNQKHAQQANRGRGKTQENSMPEGEREATKDAVVEAVQEVQYQFQNTFC